MTGTHDMPPSLLVAAVALRKDKIVKNSLLVIEKRKEFVTKWCIKLSFKLSGKCGTRLFHAISPCKHYNKARCEEGHVSATIPKLVAQRESDWIIFIVFFL